MDAAHPERERGREREWNIGFWRPLGQESTQLPSPAGNLVLGSQDSVTLTEILPLFATLTKLRLLRDWYVPMVVN